MGLQRPPRPERTGRVFGRLLVVLVLAVVAGVVIWATATNQRIDLVEDVEIADLEIPPKAFIESNGFRIYFVDEGGGPIPVVLLHDADVAGSVIWEQVAGTVTERYRPVRVDLPGFGLSERRTTEGSQHTVSVMAATVAEALSTELSATAVLVGVGLGGEVAAEIAVTRPDLVQGLVMIDVDFAASDGWLELAERVPIIGRAVTHTWETSGRFAAERWSPHCVDGGWCPSPNQLAVRQTVATLEGTTDSFHAFRNTPPASLVPSDLDQITVPTAYVWSTRGRVASESVEMIGAAIPAMTVHEVDTWDAHLEEPETIWEAVGQVAGES